jgi:3-phosphoshikimate 1-carboxyvinyltransferase
VDAEVRPGGRVAGEALVPGDKSIAHRWLVLAMLGRGRSSLAGLPEALDLASTARAVADLAREPHPELEAWVRAVERAARRHPEVEARVRLPSRSGDGTGPGATVTVSGGSRLHLRAPEGEIDCGNSGTTLRLLAGVLAGAPIRAVLTGDASLSARPMERVAEPLRRMGASVSTTGGRPPVEVRGGRLSGIRHEPLVPSAQVKGAVLLAGIAADGETTVVEPAPTRDHTERAIEALGGAVGRDGREVRVGRFDPPSFSGSVPGDVSAAAFLAGAAVLTGGEATVSEVGLNPTRLGFLAVLARLGAEVATEETGVELGEPLGRLSVAAGGGLRGTVVEAEELPGVVDEVPLLAVVAAFAEGESRFRGAGELRVKESDRLEGVASMLRGLGGVAAVEGDDLVVAGGGLRGGRADAGGDHRMAMAAVVGALAAGRPSVVRGVQAAAVSFPGFVAALRRLGARVEAAA